MKKLVLIDGNSIAYRAFFALPLLNTEKGVYTNAVYGFTTMLMKVLEEEKPTHLLVAFDAGKTTFRHETFQEYKGGRQKTPPELSEQFPLLRELLKSMGIAFYEKELYEADDIIGTLAMKAKQEGYETKIFTGDKDLLQLVDVHIGVSLTKKGISELEHYDIAHVHERYGIDPIRIVDMKGLMGDNSDNIPGVPGVGEKTALKLLTEHGSLEQVYEEIESISGKKLKEKLIDNKDQALMSKKLATIETEAPVDITLADLTFENKVTDEMLSLFKELEFRSLIEKLGEEESLQETTEEVNLPYTIVDDVKSDMFKGPSALMVEVVDENYHFADIVGLALVNETGRYFIPTDVALQSKVLYTWLADPSEKKIVFDAKRAIVALKWRNIPLQGIRFDIHMASYLIDPAESNHDFADIARRHDLHFVYPDEVFYGKGAKQKIPGNQELADHLVRKAEAIYQLEEKLNQELEKNHQVSLFNELEKPLSVVLSKMEVTGIKLNQETLINMGRDLEEQLKQMEREIHELAGSTFNINSPKQLGEILFEKLNLPVIKKTKTGYSTSADVLERLETSHEIIPKILTYRQIGKINSTYIEGLLKVVHPKTGKIHTRFNQALTQTGRLSSTDPNLQNIPIRLEEGKKIRKAFEPSEPGWLIFAADYSQIELRVLAHIAKDENLQSAFHHDLDIHTKTAMDVFGVEQDGVTSNMRRQAKAVNFGIVYGISDYGLSQNLGITRKEAGLFIDKYFESFPGVKDYMEEIVQKAKRDGFVTTLLNRRRYLPDITSRNFNLRSFAERTAMNTPIQGSAADIIKKAMVEMAKRLDKEGLKTRMLLQVHDELIFEAPEEELDILKEIVPDVMEHAVDLSVPLKVDYAYGYTWYDAK